MPVQPCIEAARAEEQNAVAASGTAARCSGWCDKSSGIFARLPTNWSSLTLSLANAFSSHLLAHEADCNQGSFTSLSCSSVSIYFLGHVVLRCIATYVGSEDISAEDHQREETPVVQARPWCSARSASTRRAQRRSSWSTSSPSSAWAPCSCRLTLAIVLYSELAAVQCGSQRGAGPSS